MSNIRLTEVIVDISPNTGWWFPADARLFVDCILSNRDDESTTHTLEGFTRESEWFWTLTVDLEITVNITSITFVGYVLNTPAQAVFWIGSVTLEHEGAIGINLASQQEWSDTLKDVKLEPTSNITVRVSSATEEDQHDASLVRHVETHAQPASLGVDYFSLLRAVMYGDLGSAFDTRFGCTGALTDISEAIKYAQQAVLLTSDGDVDKPAWLHNLGTFFENRFTRTGILIDNEKAIENIQRAISLISDEHPSRPTMLDGLGNSFASRFKHAGELRDIEKAIENHRQAMLSMPEKHPYMPTRLNNLGQSLKSRFGRTGALDDINLAIASQQLAVSLAPGGQVLKAGMLGNLGNSFHTRFARTGALNDLEEAIKNEALAVSLTPDGHANKSLWLNNFGLSLRSLFKLTGVLSDIDEAIAKQRQAVSLTPDGHANKPKWLNNLGNSFENRFKRTGVLSDVEEAIRHLQRAVILTPDGHTDKPSRLSNLGNCFQARFERTGVLGDIEQAIKYQSQAVSLTPDDHADKPLWFNSLSNSYDSRFRHTGAISDMEEAIKYQQQAVSLTPDGHADKPAWLNNLGLSFKSQFGCTWALGDIEAAVENLQKAVSLAPDGYAEKLTYLSNLGICFQIRFWCTGVLSDIEEAIKNQQLVVSLTPDGHPDKPDRLNDLGVFFQSRFGVTAVVDDLEQAILHFRLAATSKTGSPSIRFKAARQWARLTVDRDPPSAFSAYHRAIELITRISWIGDPIATRYSQLHKISDLPREAAAFALDAKRPDLALEWLEQGRSIVWNQLLALRTSAGALRQAHPDICAEFTQASLELQSAATREQTSQSSTNIGLALEEETQRHHRLAEKWDSLVERIRLLPGFADFLLPKKVSLLKKAAEMGPVVVINVHQRRCDALVLEPGREVVRHIPLDKLRYEDVKKMQTTLREDLANAQHARGECRAIVPVGNLRLEGVLLKLYLNIIHPIIQNLGLPRGGSGSSQLPRIWWCPTGPLTFLPLHAAGRKAARGRDETSNYVVSSYTPTVNALLEARAVERRPFERLVGIAMTNTPGLNRLPNAATELAKIEELFPATSGRKFEALRNEQATREQVLANMTTSNWMHLACHAAQDVQEPTQSGFYLHDQRLTLTDIIANSSSKADFAVLSACETATGDEKVLDEAVHITGAMLGAGYRSVIGTMWPIPDAAAPIVAEKVYGHLFSNGEPNSEQAAQALHEGLKVLRKSSEHSLFSWVPFVHYGL